MIKIKSAPARLKPVKVFHYSSSSIQPLSAAAFTIAYSPGRHCKQLRIVKLLASFTRQIIISMYAKAGNHQHHLHPRRYLNQSLLGFAGLRDPSDKFCDHEIEEKNPPHLEMARSKLRHGRVRHDWCILIARRIQSTTNCLHKIHPSSQKAR